MTSQLRQNGDRQLRVPDRPSTPLDLALDIFITAKEAERCTPRTVETYRFTLVRFCDWLTSQSTQEAREITPHLIHLFLASLEKHGYAASYIHIHGPDARAWERGRARGEGAECRFAPSARKVPGSAGIHPSTTGHPA